MMVRELISHHPINQRILWIIMNIRKQLTIILFLSPALIIFSVFVVYPMFASAYYSFTEWNGASSPNLNGTSNYYKLFNDPAYWQVLINTLKLVLFSVLFQVTLGLILAYLLYQTLRGMRIFRTAFFLPVIVAPVAIGIMFSLFYNSDLGPINKLLESIGLAFLRRNWLSDINIVIYSVIAPQVWQYIGLMAVILLAAMRSIPKEILESASIDGASSTRIFFSIVIPLVREMIIICIILAVTGSLKSFDHAWAITQGGPGNASSYVAIYMYKKAFLDFQFGYASAITITILIYAVSFTVLFRKLFVKETIQF